MYQVSKERLQEKIETFSQFGKTEGGGITRLSLSKEANMAREEFKKRMEAIGAKVITDDMANMYATIPGSEEGLPVLMMGSHLDSVVQGGNYDGVLGVLTGMEVAETIVNENIPHRHPITVVVWTNEEGSRFDPAMMSSGVVTGKFDKAEMLKSVDTKGVTFEEALNESPFKGEESNRVDPANVKALIELHIEQGPVMEAEDVEVGVVGGVCGMVNYEFSFKGQAGHAGTVPMHYRQDALYAAASTIMWLHEELDKLDKALVYTTGRINCSPNVHTVIPDDVKFTLDARHKDPEVVKQVVEIIKSLPKEVKKCEASYNKLWSRDTVHFDEEIIGAIKESVDDFNYTFNEIYSGPGHDAQFLADILPASMIFVPSVGGHSHAEIEHTPVEDCVKGTNVMLNAILKLDEK